MKLKINNQKLINCAIKAKELSYSPYSKFKVGASVLCSSGKIYGGSNIENASYPCGICAERSCIAHAMANGEKDFVAMAIVSDSLDYCYPCGICRQFLIEFNKDMQIIVAKNKDDFKQTTIKELLPNSFDNNSLNK